ncbi:hypothetical protein KY335_02910 [Candidatus Woesearchaeota archaeon]|nr:hypothetical protein [Candidatus Woesearchaeota archaeon]
MNKTLLIGFVVVAVLVASMVFVSASNQAEDIATEENTVVVAGSTCGAGACGAGTCDGSCGGSCGVPSCGCGG